MVSCPFTCSLLCWVLYGPSAVAHDIPPQRFPGPTSLGLLLCVVGVEPGGAVVFLVQAGLPRTLESQMYPQGIETLDGRS